MNNAIGWCTHTVNPVVGCLNGCSYCYARPRAHRVAHQLAGTGKPLCQQCHDFVPHLHPERLEQLSRGRNRRVFVGSMCDLWSPGVEQEWRREVFRHCDGPLNAYLFLTKCPENVTPDEVEFGFHLHENINRWLGVTITSEYDLLSRYQRIPWTGTRTFVSIEPLLGPLQTDALMLTLQGHTSWAIIGPGTQAAAGRTKRAWVEQAAADLRGWGIPVWLKESCFKLWPDMERIQELPEGMPVETRPAGRGTEDGAVGACGAGDDHGLTPVATVLAPSAGAGGEDDGGAGGEAVTEPIREMLGPRCWQVLLDGFHQVADWATCQSVDGLQRGVREAARSAGRLTVDDRVVGVAPPAGADGNNHGADGPRPERYGSPVPTDADGNGPEARVLCACGERLADTDVRCSFCGRERDD